MDEVAWFWQENIYVVRKVSSDTNKTSGSSEPGDHVTSMKKRDKIVLLICADYKIKMFVTFDRNKLKLKSLVASIVQLVLLSLADSLEKTV